MAKALQCPSCSTKTSLEGMTPGSTFACEKCGQVLKVPPGLGGGRAASTSAGSVGSSAADPAAPPAPRRRSGPLMTTGGGASGGGTAVLSAPAAPAGSPPLIPPPAPAVPSAAGGRARESLPLVVRVIAWVLALPLGLAIVGLPARKAGYLSSQDMLDVIVERDLGRFVPLVVVVLLWALVSAVLVTIFVEGGRRLMLRRQRKRGSESAFPGIAGPAGIAGPVGGPAPPPRRRRG